MKKRWRRWLLLSVLLGLGIAGCRMQQTGQGAGAAVVVQAGGTATAVALGPEVDPGTVAELSAEDAIAVIDVREAWEYQEGHIAGATLIPLGSLADRTDEIPTDKPVVLVCRSGNRSARAYRYLADEGFDNIHNMTGGMLGWEAAGLDVTR